MWIIECSWNKVVFFWCLMECPFEHIVLLSVLQSYFWVSYMLHEKYHSSNLEPPRCMDYFLPLRSFCLLNLVPLFLRYFILYLWHLCEHLWLFFVVLVLVAWILMLDFPQEQPYFDKEITFWVTLVPLSQVLWALMVEGVLFYPWKTSLFILHVPSLS